MPPNKTNDSASESNQNTSDRKLTKNEKRRLRDKESKKKSVLPKSTDDNSLASSAEDNPLNELRGIEIEYVSADYNANNMGTMLEQFKEIFEKVFDF